MTAESESRRGALANPFGWAFLAAFALSWTVLLLDRGRSLPLAPDLARFAIGEVFGVLVVAVLLRMARGREPIDHRSGLPIRDLRSETVGLLLYLAAVLAVGRFFRVGAHIAGAGMSEAAAVAWQIQTAGTLFRWALFNFVAGVVFPLLYFVGWRRYSPRTLLLRFPSGRKWVVFCLGAGFFGILGADPGQTFRQPVAGHVLTLVLFSLGTFLPILVLFESLLAPRLAILGRSAVTGAVLSGAAYGLFHPFEFYLDWSSGPKALVSLAWLAQLAFFGVAKGISTLWTGSAWVHIFTTHTIHLSEAPEVVRVFGLR